MSQPDPRPELLGTAAPGHDGPVPADKIRFEERIPGASTWSHPMKRGTTLRLTDIEGGANVSVLLFNFELLSERLNLPDSLKAQHTARLTSGHVLYSDMGRILCSIAADTVGWHDSLGGCSTADGVQKQYGESTYQKDRNNFHRNGRNLFHIELGKYGLTPRDLIMNVNFFSKVTVDDAGGVHFVQGHSKAGSYVDLRAEMNTLVILNTCIHPMNPSTVYAPKPVQATLWTSPTPGPEDPCRLSRPENARGFILTERYFL